MRWILGLADHERLDAAHLGRPLRRAENQGAAFCVARGLRRQIQYLLGLAVLENGVVLHREVPRHHTQLPVILRAVLVGSILRLAAFLFLFVRNVLLFLYHILLLEAKEVLQGLGLRHLGLL